MRINPVRRSVGRWLAEYPPAGPVIVAVSGGADSLALAAAVLTESGQCGLSVLAATVDHGLQDGSARQAARCAEQLRGIGFERVEILPVTVGRAGGPEAAARDARYAALRQLADQVGERAGAPGPAAVLLGHTLDDQAETVLLGLARGSGPRSIAGMRPWRSPWGRPLLDVRRVDTERVCAALGVLPWQDPHNADPGFTRVRLRTQVLPLLEQVLGGGVAPALARTADLLADDLLALDELAAQAYAEAVEPGLRSLAAADLLQHSGAVRRRALRSWLAGQHIHGLTADHLLRLDELLTARDGAAVRLPGGRDVTRRDGCLTLDSGC